MYTSIIRCLFGIVCSASLANVVLADGYETIAPTAIIIDGQTGSVLFEKNARTPIAPASMTKIMTLYMVFERIQSGALSLDDEFSVSDDAWRRGGFRSGSSTMCLKPNERVRVEDLIRGVIVLSGNDAAITLAENIGGSEANFAKTMTQRAHELGLSSVHFVNSTGWPAPGHEVSAYDLAKLSQMTIEKFPKLYAYYGQKEFTWCKAAPSNRFNRNPLLALFPGADGLKTGHTKEAGYGLVGAAVRDGKRRIVVVSGLKSKRDRVRVSERLMRASFGEFDVKKIVQANVPIGKMDVYLGKDKTVNVGVASPVFAGLFKPDLHKIRVELHYDGPIAAPITKGQKLGVVVILRPGQPDIRRDVLALTDVAQKSFFARSIVGLVRLIQGTSKEK